MVKEIKQSIHPKAYLKNVRNVRKGLKARTKILQLLDTKQHSASGLAKESTLSYSIVMHHLRLLMCEGIINHKSGRPYYWLTTGLGQKSLST
jgi:hypothetical protein